MAQRSWTPLHSQFQRTLKVRGVLPQGCSILLGFSGGQDSRCLLQLLLDLQAQWKWRLAIAHCDHRWPPDSGDNADYAAEIAAELGLEYFGRCAPRVLKGEAEGRDWRYREMVAIATQEKFAAIATAHTASDRAETLLFNLMRGSGMDGLRALTWVRSMAPGVELVRPLLDVTRAQTGAFCKALGLSVWSDTMNQDLHYRRNRIRQVVLPYAREHFNPQVDVAIARTAELLQADVSYLESQAQQLLESATVALDPKAPPPSKGQVVSQLQRGPLKQAPLALQRRALRQFLNIHLQRTPTFDHVEKVVGLLTAPNRSRTDPLESNLVAEVYGNTLFLLKI